MKEEKEAMNTWLMQEAEGKGPSLDLSKCAIAASATQHTLSDLTPKAFSVMPDTVHFLAFLCATAYLKIFDKPVSSFVPQQR